ncbi:hypothetical protein LguiA_006757 [Lonicera macranthoides]
MGFVMISDPFISIERYNSLPHDKPANSRIRNNHTTSHKRSEKLRARSILLAS